MEPNEEVKETTGTDLGALLDAGDGAMVTLEAGDTCLVAHGAVLAARSPVFAMKFRHNTPEAISGQFTITDMEGPVLRQLLAFFYTLQAPNIPDMAAQLLAAADSYGLSDLKARYEQQLVAQLSVHTAAATAILAVRHSCYILRQAAVKFIKANTHAVMATQGWADAVRNHPEVLVEVCQLLSELPPETSRSRVPESTKLEAIEEVKGTTATDLGALLDDGKGAVVTLVAGDTNLVAHRAVLEARSPVFAAKFQHDTQKSSSCQLTIEDVEGPVLRQLVAYLYTLQAPQVPSIAPQLLAAADVYGMSALKAECERQVASQLSVETAAATAVLAVRHSCHGLRQPAINFVRTRTHEVMATQGWAQAVRTQPKGVVEVCQLLSQPSTVTSESSYADSWASHASQPQRDLSDLDQTPASAEPPMAAQTSPITGYSASSPITEPAHAERRISHATEPQSDLSERDQTAASAEPPITAQASHITAQASRITDYANFSRITIHLESGMGKSLIQAAEEGAVEELKALLDAGADCRVREGGLLSSWWTALHCAANRGHEQAVRHLLAAGAEVDSRDAVQRTPLHWAAVRGHAAVVRQLAAASADPNARDEGGLTPLHLAAWYGHADAATALMDAGADVDARTDDGRTPMDIAMMNDRKHLSNVLIRRS